MKICFISHSARLAGAELVLLETIEVLQECGVKCYVVLPARGPLLAELAKLKTPLFVTSYALWVSSGRLSLLRRTLVLMNIIVESIVIAWRAWQWGCDIIYTNTATVCVGAVAAALLGRPHAWHLHEYVPQGDVDFIFGNEFSLRVMGKLSSLIIAPSRAVAGRIRSCLPGSAPQVIYCSLHRAFLGDHHSVAGNDRYRCVMAGAVAENKRQEDAVLALLELRQRQIEAELLLIGEDSGAYSRSLRRLIAQTHLQDRVRFLGQLETPMPQLRAADVVLICSRAEGFGRVAAEAMLAGKPVIGADNTATAELIHDGLNGLLYHTADPHDLAGKILYLHDHPEVALRLGHNGRAWASRMFTRERYREQLLPLLADLLPGPLRDLAL